MTQIDRLHMDLPFAGTRMLRDSVTTGRLFTVGRKPVATLMRRMGLEALYQKPRTTQRHPATLFTRTLLRRLAPESSVGHGYHVYPHGQGVCVPGDRGGLGNTPRARLARVNHDGRPVLS